MVSRSEPLMHDDDFESAEPAPSKSQLKREAHSAQQLGVKLLEAPESAWHELRLPDALINALTEARRLHARGAHKRQLQYIGKLMRDIDPQPIQAYFEQQRQQARLAAHRHHQLEDWRDRLIRDGDPAINALLAQHPDADRQHLRRLVRDAAREAAAGRPPKASRALFRYLRELA